MSLQIHVNRSSNTCLTQFKWRVEKSERGVWGGVHLNVGDDNMFAPACIGYVAPLAHFLAAVPSLSSYSLLSSSHSLVCSLFFPLSPARSLALFSSGCYISIMQPLPASEGERIRPTLPSVVACQPRLYILSRLTEMAATLFLSSHMETPLTGL